jgi:hypothetical protein
LGDTESCYIVCGPYTYSGEPTVRLETSPGRPGLVYLSAVPAPLARAASRVALVVQAPNAPPAVDAERPRDQARHRGLVVASELRVQTGLVLDTLKRRVRAAVSHLQELAFRRTPQPSILNDPAMLEQQRTVSRAQMTPAVM